MPDWTAPVHLPEFTDEKFDEMRRKHIEKEGYTITVPGLSDIIHWGTPPPMNSAEALIWKRKDWDWLPPGRREELQKMKDKKKEKFEAMLGSPTPSIISNAGSVMTSLDDAQDAASTLAAIGSVARAIAPRAVAKALLGPVGILWAVADVLNLVQQAPMACLKWRLSKREMEEMQKKSAKRTKGKLKKVDRLARAVPRQADWIQAAQVTDQIFGYGICLGPLVGLFLDMHIGTARYLTGEKVKVKLPVKGITSWASKAYKCVKSLGCNLAYPVMTDDEEVLTWFSAATLSYQVIYDDIKRWHPLDMVEDIRNVEIRAPVPEDPLTLEVIEEAGVPLAQCVGWPQTNQLWSTIQDLADTTQWGATENLERFVLRNKHSFLGLCGSATAVDSSRYALAALEGEEQVWEDFTPSSKIATKMLQASMILDPTQPHAKYRDFAGFMHQCDRDDYNPTLRDIANYCNGPAAIKLVTF